MKVIKSPLEIRESRTAVVLGTFDGMHTGHVRLIEGAKEKALNLPLVVYSFSNIPAVYFGATAEKLTTAEEKTEVLESLKIADYMMPVTFNGRVAGEAPEEFCRFLKEDMRASMIAAGFNYTFGRGAAGNMELLERFGKENGIEIMRQIPVMYGDEPVSSTRIRIALKEGDPAAARAMLGRPYSISGIVSHGKKLGRKLGFPTVNFFIEDGKLCPKNGVYGTIAEIDGKKYYAITNVGTRPTVDDGNRVNVETNMMGYMGDAYGKKIRISFMLWQREEQRFGSVDELKKQLQHDKAEILSKLQKNCNAL